MKKYKVLTTGSSPYLKYMLMALLLIAVLLPWFAGRALIQDLFFILTMLMLAQWWNLLAGYGGLVSVGQQAFVGIGGYALFALVILGGIDPIPAIFLAGFAGLLLAIPTAFFVFRLNGAYFAIGTWVIAEVVKLVVAQWKQLGGGTGTSLPRAATKDMWFIDIIKTLFDVRTSFARDILSYWIALLLLVLTIGGIYWLLKRKHGLGLSALRDNEQAAKSFGIDAQKIKWAVFLVSAFGTALVGALIYLQIARISPDAAFSVVDWTAYIIFIVVIGGIGTIEGPIIGVLLFFLLQNFFADYGGLYLVLLGIVGIVVMIFAPKGIWGFLVQKTSLQLFPVRRELKSLNDEPTA